MTHRNESKLVYGKLRLNGNEVVDLGRTTMLEMSQRTAAVIKSRVDLDITSAQTFYAESKDELAKMLKGGVQAEYAHEGLNPDSPLYGLDAEAIALIRPLEDDTPSPYPDITMSRLAEATSSPEFIAYSLLATNPDKRVGVDPGVLSEAYHNWCFAYPDVSEHVPVWKD